MITITAKQVDMQEPLQSRLPSFAAVWRLLATEQAHAAGAVVLSLCLSVFGVGSVFAQQGGTVRGSVTDGATGDPLPGANVVLAGTQQGAATDADGSYAIKGVAPGTYSVRASFLGYQETVRENIQVTAGETTTVNFSLQQQERALDELVVVGYGEQERQDVTAAVSSVSSQDLQDVQSSSLDQALQGQAAGVEVSSAGGPGEGALVRIRGLASTNNNQPLYVIDGVPTGGIQGLNPSNIQSIEVLKDASAAAIYGSRASNGVVLISTRSGQEGDMRVSFNSSVGYQNVPESKWLDLLNTQQYDEFNTRLANNTDGVSAPPAILNDTYPNQNVDWQDAVFRTGVTTNNALSLSGGSEKAQYLVSLGYTSEEGAIVETGFERYSLRVNSNYDVGRFDFSESFSVSYRKQNPMRTSEVLGLAQRYPPYLSVRDESNLGGFNGPDQPDGFDDPNPVRIQHNGFEHDKITKVVGNVTGEARIVEGLTFRQVLGLDAEYGTYDNYIPAFNDGGFQGQDFSEITENRFSNFSPITTSTLNFDKTFGSHNVSAIAGYELNATFYSISESFGENTVTPLSVSVPGSVTEGSTIGGSEGVDVLESFFGRVNYDYGGRYLVQAALRRDGFSRFGPNNKYGLFPSASVGWVLSEEAFLSDVSVLSNLKLRGSYGFTGNNQSLNRYEYQSSVVTGYEYPLGDGNTAPGVSIEALSNSDLRWERTQMLNVGADVGFFNQALTFAAEYYQNTTEDILLQISLPGSYGFAGDPRANTGEVQTSGFEFTAGYQSRGTGDLSWGVDANFSTSNNEVISTGIGNPITGATWQQAEGTATRIAEGNPIWYFWGWKTDGLFQQGDSFSAQPDAQPGDVRFVDVNGDGTIDTDDRTMIGSPYPDFYYGLSGNMTWKGVDLGVTLQGAAGHQILRDYAYWIEGMQRINNHSTKVLDAWTPNNTDTDVPRAVAGPGDPNNNNRISDRWISDGDYLRVKRVTLGYELPVGNVQSLSRARVYLQSENVFTFTGYPGYDPEVAPRDGSEGQTGDNSRGIDTGQYVQPRSFRVGVQVDF